MRLKTVGRRSGKARVAIVGYYEDGPDLVTLAMNGWADAEPAWWLNLQATPETTVELPSGTRAVRARAATETERGRLWPLFSDYPGWGEDLDGLAARRTHETAILFSSPCVQPKEHRHEAAADAPTYMASPVAGSRPCHRLLCERPVGLPRARLAPVLIFGILPHLPVLLGRGQPHAPGQLARRAVPLFNVMHHPAVALALLAIAATGALSPFWLVGAIAWLSHIVVDWAMGDGLRSADGFRLDRSIWAGRPFALREKGQRAIVGQT